MQTDSTRTSFGVPSKTVPNPLRFLIPRAARLRFCIQFTLMTVLGWVVGGIASIALERTFVELLPRWYTLGTYLSSGVFAVIFGADQALVLRRYISARLWMLGTTSGWLIANGVSTAWINYISSIASSLNKTLSLEEMVIFGFLSTISYILSGVWLGFFQWLVLRRHTKGAWWWNFIPSISFLFISILVWLLSLLQEFIPEVNRVQILYLSEQGFTAVILGFIPAIGLCTLKTSRHTGGISSSSQLEK